MGQKNFSPVRVGVVGLGRFGRLHSLTLAGLAESELVAVVARRQASLDALAHELPDVRGWLDLDRAVAESDAEAWVVASSTYHDAMQVQRWMDRLEAAAGSA